ncbi:MAG: hypothetical protein AB1486_31250, partial [Planctomycetota bacterium]
VFLGVDEQGFVSIVYRSTAGTIRFTRAYQGRDFPPSVDLGDVEAHVQIAVWPEGPIAIVFRREVSYRLNVYSLVSFDGGQSFEGPYRHTQRGGGLSYQTCLRAAPGGTLHAAWFQVWKPGGTNDPTYAQSRDYGRSFPRRDWIADNSQYPGMYDMSLGVTPDDVKCVVDAASQYTQCRQ